MTKGQIDAIIETRVDSPRNAGAIAALTDEAREFAYLINGCCSDGRAKLGALGRLQESLHAAVMAVVTSGA